MQFNETLKGIILDDAFRKTGTNNVIYVYHKTTLPGSNKPELEFNAPDGAGKLTLKSPVDITVASAETVTYIYLFDKNQNRLADIELEGSEKDEATGSNRYYKINQLDLEVS